MQYLVKTEDGKTLSLAAAEWDLRREAASPPKQGTPGSQGAETRAAAPAVSVSFVQIQGAMMEGDTDTRMKDAILAAVEAARRKRAQIVVLEIDTPGGMTAFAEDICRAVERLKGIKSVAYIPGGRHRGAFSAGALVALACDEIYVAQGASIGAATPYLATEWGPLFEQKITSAFAARFRALAEQHGRPKALAGAMVDPDIELREVILDGKKQAVPGEVVDQMAKGGARLGAWVSRKGKVLTMTGSEAAELGFSNGVANSLEELLARLGVGKETIKSVVEAEWRARFQKGKVRVDGLIASAKARDPLVAYWAWVKWGAKGGEPDHSGEVLSRREKSIDEALSELQDLLDIAAACPPLKTHEDAIRRKMGLLKQWRQSAVCKAPSGL
jgi:hypothetical protein